VGGELVGIRLAHWYIADINRVSASVIVEVLVTVVVQYAFSALGLLLMASTSHAFAGVRLIGLALLLSLPVPVVFFILVRRGGLFQALEKLAARWLGSSRGFLSKLDGVRLDREIDTLMRRPGLLASAFAWQLSGYMLGALEVYWALAFFGHLVSIASALAVEALTQAVRHAAFFLPAGLGVQEAAIMVLAQMAGADRQAAIALALVKRMREVLFGCIALAGWQLAEMRRNSRSRLTRG
jgi:putative membrane protein